MTTGHAGASSHLDRSPIWATTAASLVVGAAFFSLWFWLLPSWLGFRVDSSDTARWRWIFVIPSILGFTIALRCVWDFGWTGQGTPAPVAPPQKLVAVGFYRYVPQSYVYRIYHWLVESLDYLRPREFSTDHCSSTGCFGSRLVRAVL